jgi:pyruvate dehydrogenase E2 component (dihydrolipoamide acetyltransferase)
MALEVVVPALGAAQSGGRLVRWLRREGERVTTGEPLAAVETDRIAVQVLSPGAGVLSGLRVGEGEHVAVGAVIAYLLAPAAKPNPTPFETPPARAARARQEPAARAGPSLSEAWRAMSERTARSWRHVPHLFLLREVDASQLVVARERQPDEVTFTDLLVRLTAVTLARHPRMNSARAGVNVALAVSLEGGLVAPVIHGADRLDLATLAARRAELVARARSGRLHADDLAGGTFTVSNLGMFGVDAFLTVVDEGQAGALAVGRIADRVVPVLGRPQVRPVLALSLSCDHRAIDGAAAARFLGDLAATIEEPAGSL